MRRGTFFRFGTGLLGWGLAIACVVLAALVAALFFRQDVVEMFPALAEFYAAIGLPVHVAAAAHG